VTQEALVAELDGLRNVALKPYSSYAPSPVPWLDDVPSEWSAIRLDRLFRYRNEEPLETDGRVTGYLDGRVTLRSNVAYQKIKGVVYETGWQRIHVGDFAISGMNAHLGGMGVSDSEGKCSPIYLILEPLPRTNARFVSLAVRHAAHLGAIKALVQTIRFNSADMKRADLKSIYVPVPSIAEQEQIVRFVRHLDSKVNRLIKAKRRLIELLNEQKQAIIHQAVTRGLDPTVSLKPSGLPWCPMIPAHWSVVPNSMMVRPKKRLVGERHSEFTLLSLTRQGVIVRDLSENKGKFSKDLGTSQEVREGDLVFCLFDIPETPRTVGKSSHYGMITSAYSVFEPNNQLQAAFLEAFYIAMDDRKLLSPLYSGLRNTIAPSRFLSVKTPMPQDNEVAPIMEQIRSGLAEVGRILEVATKEIDLIREYRTRLVADVVTGQLDVRHIDLPEVDGQLEALVDDTGLEDDPEETDDSLEEVEP